MAIEEKSYMNTTPGSFTTTVSNIPLADVDDKTITAYPNWITPPEFQAMGYPKSIPEVFDYFGSTNVTCMYYCGLKGQMEGYNCNCKYNIVSSVMGLNSSTAISSIIIWSTGESTKTDETLNYVDKPMSQDNPHLTPYYVKAYMTDDGRSGCTVCGSPDFKNVEMIIKVVVQINLDSWCITPNQNYMHDDMCFNYFSDKGAAAKMQDNVTTTYLRDYCSRKYPDGQLDMFYLSGAMDAKDYQMCACNMPATEYTEFKSSVVGADPQFGPWSAECLFSPCYASNFKPSNINGCPQPDCLNITAINGSTVSGDVTVKQNADCANVQTTNPGTDTASTASTSSSYWWILILVSCLLFLFVLAGGAFFVFTSMSKTKGGVPKVKTK